MRMPQGRGSIANKPKCATSCSSPCFRRVWGCPDLAASFLGGPQRVSDLPAVPGPRFPPCPLSLTLKEWVVEPPSHKGSGRAGGRQTLVSEGLVSSSIY